jgi:hypothetical protein
MLVAALALGYGLWQFVNLMSAPRLSIEQPATDTIVDTSSIEVSGRTSSGAEVFINSEAILIEPDGRFSEMVTLRRGLNELEIVAVNALAKRAVVHRSIVFQPRTK